MGICKKGKEIFKRIIRNCKYIAKKTLLYTSYIVAAIQFFCFLIDLNDIFPSEISFIKRLLISVSVVAIIWLVMFIIISYQVLKNHIVEVINDESNNHVYVEYGDLLEDTNEKRNIVITVNRCFDTIVDDDLITSGTIHGKVIKKICVNGYTEQNLNEALQEDLVERRKISPEMELTAGDKRKGNLKRYPAGTIAEFKKHDSDNITYFFLGMSAFNKDLHAETTDIEYVTTIQSLIEYCNTRSQKIPIYMPIIGAYGLNNKKKERELLEYIVNTFSSL